MRKCQVTQANCGQGTVSRVLLVSKREGRPRAKETGDSHPSTSKRQLCPDYPNNYTAPPPHRPTYLPTSDYPGKRQSFGRLILICKEISIRIFSTGITPAAMNPKSKRIGPRGFNIPSLIIGRWGAVSYHFSATLLCCCHPDDPSDRR